MATTADILTKVIPIDGLKLGWLVLDKRDPRGDCYLETSPGGIRQTDVHANNWEHNDELTRSHGFKAFLSGLLDVGLRLNKGVSTNLSALRAVVSTIDHCDEWFQEICGQDEVRRWIEERLDCQGPFVRIWLVSGLHIAEGVKVQTDVSQGFEAPLEVTVPLTALLGDPGIIGQLLGNPGAGIDIARMRRTATAFDVDDMIYAVQYRRVKIRFFNKPERFRLGKNCWEVMTVNAGAEGEPQELVEASLVGSFDDDEDSDVPDSSSLGADDSDDDEESGVPGRNMPGIKDDQLSQETFHDPDTGEDITFRF